MAKEFNSISELENYINQQMTSVLENEVASKVKNIEQEKVIAEVYDKYSPSTPDGEPFVYKRRGWKDGLADQKNMQHSTSVTPEGVELIVENTTKGKDQNFEIADLVEYGDGTNGKEYQYKSNRDGTANQYLRARPFTKSTIDTLEQTNQHVQAFKQGMKSRGINIE